MVIVRMTYLTVVSGYTTCQVENKWFTVVVFFTEWECSSNVVFIQYNANEINKIKNHVEGKNK